MFSLPWVREQLKNSSEFQVQMKPMSSVMPITHNAIMILVRLVTTSQIFYKMCPTSLTNTDIKHVAAQLLHNIIPTWTEFFAPWSQEFRIMHFVLCFTCLQNYQFNQLASRIWIKRILSIKTSDRHVQSSNLPSLPLKNSSWYSSFLFCQNLIRFDIINSFLNQLV